MGFPVIPNPHALAVLLLTVLALILFTREKIALESSSLFVLVVIGTPLTILMWATLSVIMSLAYGL